MSIGAPLSRYDDYPAELRHPAEGADHACYVCGQRRGKRDPDDAWLLDHPLDPRGPRERPKRDENGETHEELKPQAWRWRHTSCVPTGAGMVQSVLGLAVPEDVARRAIAEVEVPTARNVNETGARPWGHLQPGQRELLRSVVQRELLVGLARMHVSGRCGWCGRSRSSAWTASGLVWPDGEAAALCEVCADARQHVRDKSDPDSVRRAAMRLAMGLLDAVGRTEHYGFRFACEVLDDERRHDDEQAPWTYSPTGLAAVRERAYRVEAGSIADEDHRHRTLRILAAKRARAAAERAAVEAEPEVAW